MSDRIVIRGKSIRRNPDGSVYLTRRDTELEKYLDVHYERVGKGYLWRVRIEPTLDTINLISSFKDKMCYIVGKGPSLDSISGKDFPENWPIICINESIHKIESLQIENEIFMMQQDQGLKDTCRPKRGTIIISNHASQWYANDMKRYIYSPKALGLTTGSLTVVCAITLAKKLGVTGFVLLCFDACVNQKLDYASCVGYPHTRGGKPNRFINHKKYIEDAVGNMKTTWITPIPSIRDTKVDGTLPHKSDNLEEHHEPDQFPRSTVSPAIVDLSLKKALLPHDMQPDR